MPHEIDGAAHEAIPEASGGAPQETSNAPEPPTAAKPLLGEETVFAELPPREGAPPEGGIRPPTAAERAAFVRRKHPDAIIPVSDTDWRITFIADHSVVRRLESARVLLARRHPEARLEDALGAVLEMFLDKADPLRRAAARTARTATRSPSNAPLDSSTAPPLPENGVRRPGGAGAKALRRKALPAAVRDAVLARDGGRCAFIGCEGRCPETRQLELDHIVPKALGGGDEAQNLRPLCRAHNRFMAEVAFGEAHIAEAIRRRRRGAEAV